MTNQVLLAIGSTSVDLTQLNPYVAHRFSNPIIFLPTPATTGGTLGQNNIAMNLGFFDNSFDLTFILTDGPGSFNFTPSHMPTATNYEKLIFMAADPTYGKNPKTLTLNGTAFYGHIESVTVAWKSEQGMLALNCNVSFRVTANLVMA
jgi:hypothetical protein